MALMYEVNALNAAMIQAAELCRQDMPEGEKVNAVLACFAGMKPVEAEPVVHGMWDDSFDGITPVCSVCGRSHSCMRRTPPYCPHCGARMDGGAADAL